jgi:hypothetical protein
MKKCSGYLALHPEQSTQSPTARSSDVPLLLSDEQHIFDDLFAKSMYVQGTSLRKASCPYLLKSLEVLRPDVKIPDSRRLSHTFLDNNYESCKSNMNTIMVKLRACVLHLMDGPIEI